MNTSKLKIKQFHKHLRKIKWAESIPTPIIKIEDTLKYKIQQKICREPTEEEINLYATMSIMPTKDINLFRRLIIKWEKLIKQNDKKKRATRIAKPNFIYVSGR